MILSEDKEIYCPHCGNIYVATLLFDTYFPSDGWYGKDEDLICPICGNDAEPTEGPAED